MFRSSLFKTIKRPVFCQSRFSAAQYAGHTLTVPSISQSLKRRWQSTDVHAIKNITKNQSIIKALQENGINAERKLKQEDETPLIHESEIKLIRPILFFLAVGVTAFGFAAYMTMKKTEDLVRIINECPDPFQNYLKIIPEEMQEVVAQAYGDIQENIAKIPDGNTMALWGNFNEAELRIAKKKHEVTNFFINCAFTAKWIRETADHFGLSESTKDIMVKIATLGYGLPKNILLAASDETLTPIPAVVCMAAAMVTVKISKKFRVGNKVYNFLSTNMMRAIPTSRLHTLTTSILWQNSSWNLAKYSIPIIFLSSSFLYPPSYQLDSNNKRIAESTTLYHFIAFCITSATFSNAFSLVLSRIVLKKARKAGDFQLVAKLLTKTPGIGAGAIAYSLMATCASLFPTFENLQSSRWSSISLAFILHELRYVTLIFSGRKYLDGVDHFARFGGILFGFFYARYGNVMWENAKRTLYRQDKQLLEIVKPKEMESILQSSDLGTEIIALTKDQDYFVSF